jgi:hypothetical protein
VSVLVLCDEEIQTLKRSKKAGGALVIQDSGLPRVDIFPLAIIWVEWLNDRSRMNGDIHVRVCESHKGKFLWATRPEFMRHAAHSAQMLIC